VGSYDSCEVSGAASGADNLVAGRRRRRRRVVKAASGADSMTATITGPRYFKGEDLPELVAMPAFVPTKPEETFKLSQALA